MTEPNRPIFVTDENLSLLARGETVSELFLVFPQPDEDGLCRELSDRVWRNTSGLSYVPPAEVGEIVQTKENLHLEVMTLRARRVQELSVEESFSSEWDRRYKPHGYSWQSNPHVWVLELKKVEVIS